jgi:AraC family transcriptional regulator
MKADIVDQPAMRVFAVEHRGAYNRIGEAFGKLGEIAGPAGLFVPNSRMIGVYYDDPDATPESELRSKAGVTVSDSAKLPPGLTEVRIPAGRVARATHIGGYEGLNETWARLTGEWLEQSGQRMGEGVSYEIYLNTPMDTPKEKLRTELYIPLQPVEFADRARRDVAEIDRGGSRESRFGDSRD